MRKLFLFLLFLTLVAYGQVQKRVAILNTVDDGEQQIELTDVNYLTGKLRDIAVKTLPQDKYFVMSVQSIVDKLGSWENARKACEEAEGCLAKLGQRINADYIGQARLGRFGGNLTINMELYNSGNGVLMGTFAGESKDVSGLLEVLNREAPAMFRKMPGVSGGHIIEGGIDGVQTAGNDYEFEGKKPYLVNISSDPEGAGLSFNGVPKAKCKETPCKVELSEGSVRIIANLEQYEIADTTVSIKQNNQSIHIRMKANFGVLEIKPAYSDGIGRDELWNLTINGNVASSWKNKLSPNKYKVELSHRCYEAVSFEAGISRDKREVFDMASHIRLKKGGLVLSAEADDEPVSEPVFVNGVQVGETPFSGSVPLCAKIEIGAGREEVNVNIKYNKSVKYTHKMNTDERRRSATKQAEQIEEGKRRAKRAEEWQLEREREEHKNDDLKEPRFTLGIGSTFIRDEIGFISINPEFVCVADSHLCFGADVDFGYHKLLFRGGTLAKLLLAGEINQLYLMAGASWYGDRKYNGPSFSVGGGFRTFIFVDVQYFIMPMNNRNANYLAIKGGLSLPGWKDIFKGSNSKKENKY